MWNSLPQEAVGASLLDIFKRGLDTALVAKGIKGYGEKSEIIRKRLNKDIGHNPVIMLNFCPDLKTASPDLRMAQGEFIFLIDCSGTFFSVVGQISNNDESKYGREIEGLVTWCNENNLSLNISKTRELIIDFRKKGGEHAPIYINGT
eukprot:g31767.t1